MPEKSKRPKQWLRENLGRTLVFSFGSVQHEAVLKYNRMCGMYTFTISGTEYNAEICEIWT